MIADLSSQRVLPSSLVADADDEGGLQLGRVLAAIQRRALLVAGLTVAVAAAAAVKALTDTPVYQASFELLTEPVTVETEVISSNPETLSSRSEDLSMATLDETKIEVLTSPKVINPVIKQLQSQFPLILGDQEPESLHSAFVRNLSINKKTENTNVLAVQYIHPDPAFVQTTLDLISDAFINYSLTERQADVLTGLKFVEAQLGPLQSRVDEQQERLQRLRQGYNLIDPVSEGELLSEQVSAVANQRLENQLQLEQARQLYAELQAELAMQPIEAAASSVLSEHTRYQELLSQLTETDKQLAEKSALFLESNPEIQVLQEKRNNLLPLLRREGQRALREVESRIRELEAQDRVLQQSIGGLNQRTKQLSVVTRQYNDIQRELEIATENLNLFLKQREALRIDASQKEAPWQLLTPPGKPRPSSASLKRNLALGTTLGLLLGIGVALAVDKLSNVIYTSKDLKEITRLPLLGTIPYMQLHDAKPFREALRTLSTNISLLSPDHPVRSLVISSAVPGSGKTTISMHLAQAAAATGQRVLIVDADLRRPVLHHRLNLIHSKGLTNVITDNLNVMDVIQQVTTEESLFVLGAGSVPPDPSKILASHKFQSVIQQLKKSFDLIIYDAPPILGFSDVSLLASLTDGIVIVARLGQLKTTELEQTLEELKFFGNKVFGIVANGSNANTVDSLSYYEEKEKGDFLESSNGSSEESSVKSLLPADLLKKIGLR